MAFTPGEKLVHNGAIFGNRAIYALTADNILRIGAYDSAGIAKRLDLELYGSIYTKKWVLDASADSITITGLTQTIAAGTAPTAVTSTPGTAAPAVTTMTGTIGGATSIATTGTGGVGGGMVLTAGAGGVATAAATAATGGAGGAIAIVCGAGGAESVTTTTALGGAGGLSSAIGGAGGATSSAATTSTGGAGGAVSKTGGVGGAVSGAVSGTATGGAGGAITLTTGAGGAVTATTGTNVGGAAGTASLVGGVGGAASGATDTGGVGGAVAITAGAGGAGDTGGAGGSVTITAGDGGSGGNVAAGNISIVPGAATGSGAAGSVTIGKAVAAARAGVRNQASRIIECNKPTAPVDIAGSITATVTQLLDAGIFLCSATANLTLPSMQGASGLVQALPGTPAVGDIISFVQVVAAGQTATLLTSSGSTISGIATTAAAATGRRWIGRITAVTTNSETVTWY